MASRKRSKEPAFAATPDNETTRAIADSAQKIWLAGLGAYERARSEGPRMFEVLVEQGRGLGGKAREAADQALKSVRDNASGASGRFDKLEQVFEQRVAKSLDRLGVLTRGEVGALTKQVAELAEEVRRMIAKSNAAGGTAKRPARKAKAKRSRRKTTRALRARPT